MPYMRACLMCWRNVGRCVCPNRACQRSARFVGRESVRLIACDGGCVCGYVCGCVEGGYELKYVDV